MTRMNTEICWRSSVLTALIIYPQMLDRCYTDFHLFQICLTSVDCIGPQADCFEERELWRIDRELKEIGPLAEQFLNCSDYLSADVRQMLYGFSSVSDLFNICGLYWSASRRVGEQQLSKIGQQLKENVCVPWMISSPNKECKQI